MTPHHNCSLGLGRCGGLHSTYCRTLGVQHRRGPACLGSVIDGSFPSRPPNSLVCTDGLDVVRSSNAPANGTPSCINRFRLACDRLRLPLHAGKLVVRASSAPILGAELEGVHCIFRHARDKGQSLVFTFLPSWVVLNGPCLPCIIVWACVPLQLRSLGHLGRC